MDREVAKVRITGNDLEAPALLDHDSLAGVEPMLDRIDPDGRRSVDDDKQHVSLFVHLIGDSLVSRPGKQGRVQVVGSPNPI